MPEEGFELLEQSDGFLKPPGGRGELTERCGPSEKLLRRFLWHDRIHAKAMYRMAMRTFWSL